MVLTDRQRNDLENAILEYLKDNNFTNAYEALANEKPNHAAPRMPKLLEKKWTTVVRMEKKIQDLEKKIKQLEDELKNTNPYSKVFTSRKKKDAVPQQCRLQLKGHRQAITHVGFHPSFGMLVSSSEDSTLIVWDADTGKQEKILKGHTNAVNYFDFHPDGSSIISCSSDLNLKLWDFSEFRCKRTYSGHEHTISQCKFISNGSQIVSCSRDHSIRLWETDTGYCSKTFTGHSEWVRSISTSPSSTLIASAAMDKIIKVWDTSTGRVVSEIRDDYELHIECITFGSEETNKLLGVSEDFASVPRYLVAGSRDKSIRIFDVDTGDKILTLSGHDNWVRGCVFHPNGKYLISVSDDRSIRVWDISKKRCHFTIDNAHDSFISTCAWNPVIHMLATGGSDKIVKIWDCY